MGNKQTRDDVKTSTVGSQDEPKDVLDQKSLSSTFKKHSKQPADGNNIILTKTEFQGIFPASPEYGELLYEHISSSESPETLTLREDKYVMLGKEIIQLIDRTKQIQWFFTLFSKGKDKLTKEDVKFLLFTSCKLSWACSNIDLGEGVNSEHPLFVAMIDSMFGRDETEVDWHGFKCWIGVHCGNLFQDIQAYTAMCMLGQTPGLEQASQENLSEMLDRVKTKKSLLNMASVWALSCTLPYGYFPSRDNMSYSMNLAGLLSAEGWHVLYSSGDMGLSVNSFQHHALEYKGASLMLVSFKDMVFCVAADEEWKESGQRWGGVETCLLQITPQYKVVQGGAPMLYLNLTDRTQPMGLQVGKSPQTTVLEIDKDLSVIRYFGVDSDLHSVEVVGCAGLSAREAQLKQRQWEQKDAMRQKDRKFKISKEDWQDSPDRQILEMGGVKTEHEER